MGHIYAGDSDSWGRVASALLRAAERGEAAGLDSEFFNVDVRSQSCVARSRIHLWSVAIKRWPHVLHPRGYHLADAAVLPAPALEHPPLRRWLESSAPKMVHNAPVDAHSFANHGVVVGGVINTLALARWVFPERARGAGFGLDSLGTDFLGLGKTEGYSDIFTEEVEILVKMRKVTTKSCSCGVLGCKKRKPEEFDDGGEFWVKRHDKRTEVTEEPVMKKVMQEVPLEAVVPGHPLFDRAVAYSARDSIVGLGVGDVLMRKMEAKVPCPW